MTPRRRKRWRSNLERADAYFATKITQQSTVKTHKAEDILERKSLPLGILYVGGRHGNAGEHAVMPRRAEYSCSSGIIFFCILIAMQNK